MVWRSENVGVWKSSRRQEILIVNMIFVLGLVIIVSSIDSGLGLKIIQQQMVKDENDFFHLIGIAQNNINETIDNIYAIGNLLSSDNTTIGNYSTQVMVHPLNPLEMTPYDITIYDKGQNDQIKNHSVKFTFNVSDSENFKNFNIHSVNSRSDMLGFFFISGRITNEMGAISNNTLVIAAVKDENEKLLGVWKAQTEPYNIAPSSTASFTIPITDNNQALRIANYTLFINNS
jgi:hypothetical protein